MKNLTKVRRAAAKAASARGDLEHAIHDAYEDGEAGLSLRQIAAAANMSHEQVRRIVRLPEWYWRANKMSDPFEQDNCGGWTR